MRHTPYRIKGFEVEPAQARASVDAAFVLRARSCRTTIMYVENKSERLNNFGRIGRVCFSKTGKSLYYRGKTFQSLKGTGFKANYFDIETGEHYWFSGPKKTGGDRLYGTRGVHIDDDVREEYWLKIRQLPNRVNEKTA